MEHDISRLSVVVMTGSAGESVGGRRHAEWMYSVPSEGTELDAYQRHWRGHDTAGGPFSGWNLDSVCLVFRLFSVLLDWGSIFIFFSYPP